MNGTPRLRSAYPSSPNAHRKDSEGIRAWKTALGSSSRLPDAPRPSIPLSTSNPPLIPLNTLDAPTQRLYALAVWGLILIWRLFDWGKLMECNSVSLWLFVKWTIVDAGFLYGIPSLRIPWLEWSMGATFWLFVTHALLNGMLMFRIPLPVEGSLLLLAKTLFYDRELSISENSVRPDSILNNASLIMGKQIINILPEGSAALNPNHLSFCIDNDHHSVKLPLVFNETKPEVIQLLRIDFETNQNEIIEISKSDRRKLKPHLDEPGVQVLYYPVHKTGVYRLNKVVDDLHLEVQCKISDTLVVNCPKVVMKSSVDDRCLGDLSDTTMELAGTPPLKVVYSRTINKKDRSFHFQRNQPDGFVSPLLASSAIGTLVSADHQDVSWGRTRSVLIPLNESMTTSGEWLYSVDEIHDAAGNFANYSAQGADGEQKYPRGSHLERRFHVHERPLASLPKCDIKSPLMVAQGASTRLPVTYRTLGKIPDDTSHMIRWKFSPIDTLSASGNHGDQVIFHEHSAKDAHHLPVINEEGLYTLTSVKSKFCDGQIQEPASCLLLNPPVPQLSLQAENIHDRCAGNPIGLLVDFDLIGTPPFTMNYEVTTRSGTRLMSRNINTLRDQIELKPTEAGLHKYKFVTLSDAVYDAQKLVGRDMLLEQDVRPPASAHLRHHSDTVTACIEESVDFTVELYGEKPFTLEYELIHDGKRMKEKIHDIYTDILPIRTEPLHNGGQYLLVLATVQDNSGCRISLNDGLNITVRHQRPRASFGQMDGMFQTKAIEGHPVSLPLRLTGQKPWKIKYRNQEDTSGQIHEKNVHSANDVLTVNERGKYEILEVTDSQCPGSVEPSAAIFEIDWVPRPRLELADTAVVVPTGERYLKREVCQVDIDSVDIKLTGSPPYHVKYATRLKSLQGASTLRNKEFDAGLEKATISMDTSKAGSVEYIFSELSDNHYDYDPKKPPALILEQTVNPKPSAQFKYPGKSYGYCKEAINGNEVISVSFTGTAPFYAEFDIKHQTKNKAETITVPNIPANQYDLRIPQGVLSLGAHQVSIRKVRDAKGCQHKSEYKAATVQVQVFDEATIYPLESRTHYCVGERISYTLSGQAPFEIHYSFRDAQRVAKAMTNNFKRIADKPGTFTINAISDKASDCLAKTEITRIIHEMPSVKISKGRKMKVDIHEGHKADILFEFWGTPPFEFMYTRSTNAKKGQRSEVLETRHEISQEHSMVIPSSLEGTYEVVTIKDKFCAFSTQRIEKNGQKLFQF